ncbi:hypothetical protein CBR14_22240 [Cronobacter sakazakii]|nr:hypothetical protein CBR14_22240 [Cronobacter sakazakii]
MFYEFLKKKITKKKKKKKKVFPAIIFKVLPPRGGAGPGQPHLVWPSPPTGPRGGARAQGKKARRFFEGGKKTTNHGVIFVWGG